jgi:NAD(P)-dependent dehydrogenase (short-subunit alcohol dehydrogenase family)
MGDERDMAHDGRVALVTGASSGIGKAAALALLADGWRVVLSARRKDRLDEAIAQARAPAETALAIAADVTDPASIHALFTEARAKLGRLDLLFNNAGVNGPPGLLEDITIEQWKDVVDTNLTGVFLCTQEAFRIMKAQTPMGGRIINNGSLAAHVPRPDSAVYTATKHAIAGLTKSTSLDGRKYDIACGQIDIGNARTELAERQPRGPHAEPLMDVEIVGRAVVHMANLPLDANVQFMTIMATKMPFIGRG